MLRTVNRAIAEHRILEIEYEPLNKPRAIRFLQPYGLAIYQSSIYVAAIESNRPGDEDLDPQERLRNWKLDRFSKATALDEWFKPLEEVDLEHVGQSVGIFSGDKSTPYRIKLSDKAARWIQEDPWHAQQEIQTMQDGSAILTVPAYHSMEVIPRVLQLGIEAELLEPDAARKEIAVLVKQLAKKY